MLKEKVVASMLVQHKPNKKAQSGKRLQILAKKRLGKNQQQRVKIL